MAFRTQAMAVGLAVSTVAYVNVSAMIFLEAAKVSFNVEEIYRTSRLRQAGEAYPSSKVPQSGERFMHPSKLELKPDTSKPFRPSPSKEMSAIQSFKSSWNQGVMRTHQFLVESFFLDEASKSSSVSSKTSN
eukprot:gb/GEZN01032109.1/.p2 GENE.gb/GEZN01032109.1/~~gb/GEZN01032109.1/.p2  ORF type:complete len:132 (+),score=23.52 gb/GEZN01032109.1/:20-415(+)